MVVAEKQKMEDLKPKIKKKKKKKKKRVKSKRRGGIRIFKGTDIIFLKQILLLL